VNRPPLIAGFAWIVPVLHAGSVRLSLSFPSTTTETLTFTARQPTRTGSSHVLVYLFRTKFSVCGSQLLQIWESEIKVKLSLCFPFN